MDRGAHAGLMRGPHPPDEVLEYYALGSEQGRR